MKLRSPLVGSGTVFVVLMGLALVWSVGAPTPAWAEDDGHEHDGHEHEAEAHEDEDAHKGHDHEEHAHEGEDEEDHSGHDREAEAHEDEDAHEGHAHEEEGLQLTAQQRERFGIVIRAAGPGSLRNEVSLPGEVVFNEDRVVHLVPRAPGIAVEVYKTLGESVRAGETLALIDSADLASAKLDYFAAATEVGCCRFELPRAQAIHDNTLKLLHLLESSPPLEKLKDYTPGEMGDYRSRLISAYAEHVRTGREYEWERTLVSKKVSSEGEFLAAESAFKKAQAEYWGARDSVAFEVQQNLREATRERQLAEFQAETAGQKLRMLGLSDTELAGLAAPPPAGEAGEGQAHECTDPNCKDCAAHEKGAAEQTTAAPQLAQTNLGWYEIKAPFDGVIVQKHITRGERVGDDADIFTVVDTASVWVNLTVYTKDLASVAKGREVVLRAEHSGSQARGRIAAVTPFVEESSRTATARVVLDNADGRWVPGTFVTGFVSSSEEDLPVVVPRDAVQTIEGRDVVFVEHEDGLEMTPVTIGRADRGSVEIASGLEPGSRYVAEGAFQLKATVITSSLDAHAGHGH